MKKKFTKNKNIIVCFLNKKILIMISSSFFIILRINISKNIINLTKELKVRPGTLILVQ